MTVGGIPVMSRTRALPSGLSQFLIVSVGKCQSRGGLVAFTGFVAHETSPSFLQSLVTMLH